MSALWDFKVVKKQWGCALLCMKCGYFMCKAIKQSREISRLQPTIVHVFKGEEDVLQQQVEEALNSVAMQTAWKLEPAYRYENDARQSDQNEQGAVPAHTHASNWPVSSMMRLQLTMWVLYPTMPHCFFRWTITSAPYMEGASSHHTPGLPSPSDLSILYFNCKKHPPKLHNLRVDIAALNPSVVCIVETWLLEDISDLEISCNWKLCCSQTQL